MSRKKTAKVLRYTVELFRDTETGGYTAVVPALPGCVSEGKDMAKALAHVEEAIRGYVACLREDGLPVPLEEEPVARIKVEVAA